MDIEKKYELIPSDKQGLYRIKALKDFNDVKKGDIGGYIQSENNLSQLDDCWIYDNAKVYDNAIVRDNVQVCGKAIVCDNARIRGYAVVQHDAVVRGNADVSGNARIWGNAEVSGDAIISSDKDYIVFKNWWSSGRYFTWTRSNNMWKVGCFYGSGEKLIAKAYKDSEEKGREYEKIVRYAEGENKHYTQSLEKTWKPTQKQLDAIELAKTFVIDDFGENPTLTDTLNELLEQLKKLTGEDIQNKKQI